jgi:hypothetical protein
MDFYWGKAFSAEKTLCPPAKAIAHWPHAWWGDFLGYLTKNILI